MGINTNDIREFARTQGWFGHDRVKWFEEIASELDSLRTERNLIRKALEGGVSDKERAAFGEGLASAAETAASIYVSGDLLCETTKKIISSTLDSQAKKFREDSCK